jgi:hypothetical protein
MKRRTKVILGGLAVLSLLNIPLTYILGSQTLTSIRIGFLDINLIGHGGLYGGIFSILLSLLVLFLWIDITDDDDDDDGGQLENIQQARL